MTNNNQGEMIALKKKRRNKHDENCLSCESYDILVSDKKTKGKRPNGEDKETFICNNCGLEWVE